MSKFLHLGMSLEDVIRATTLTPAKAMQVDDRIGILATGMQADVVLLDVERGQFPLVDSEQKIRMAAQRLVPVSVCKRGHWTACGDTVNSAGNRHRGVLTTAT